MMSLEELSSEVAVQLAELGLLGAAPDARVSAAPDARTVRYYPPPARLALDDRQGAAAARGRLVESARDRSRRGSGRRAEVSEPVYRGDRSRLRLSARGRVRGQPVRDADRRAHPAGEDRRPRRG